ncbi:hypothetical protein [Variovorax sp. OV329]|uniref:hypothetical protein n=1 Tax=Variovorax sp. OV329 TaxID=1882825 RepID=UPI0008E4E784|nr:hypothetical protein [Variovorax sp. OV329]SFN01257.1 hypothetical protein SAMN05444747_11310 [Variovorax sp. OV329]
MTAITIWTYALMASLAGAFSLFFAALPNLDTLAKVASIAIWCFAIMIAVNQLALQSPS